MNDIRERLYPAIARAAIAKRLGIEWPEPDTGQDPALARPGASFVTLHKHGALRGCIGSLSAHRPLAEDIAENACAAAFGDPRFPPLSLGEFDEIDIEVSVLSKPEPLPVRSEQEAIARLRPGRDGVILRFGPRQATFLPQVWEQLPDPVRFLAHLKLKAGLPADFWDPGVELEIYSVEQYAERPDRNRRTEGAS